MLAQIATVAADQPITSASGGRVPALRRKLIEASFTRTSLLVDGRPLYTDGGPFWFPETTSHHHEQCYIYLSVVSFLVLTDYLKRRHSIV
jgi:hypothetical protein